jgi:hypothetical protein
LDQLVKGVVAAEDALEVLPLPPAQAIKRVDIKNRMIIFKAVPRW